MKKRLLFVLFVLTMLFSIAANAYEPLIREDRIWEYKIIYNWYEETTIKPIFFKFDGTEIINDKTYHKLTYWYPEEENPEVKTIAYMREDYKSSGGVVFVIVNQKDIKLIDGEISWMNCFDLQENTEFILYNFIDLNSWPGYGILLAVNEVSAFESYSRTQLDDEVGLVSCGVFKDIKSLNGRSWIIYHYFSRADFLKWEDKYKYFNIGKGQNHSAAAIGVGNIGRGFLFAPAYTSMTSSMVYSYSCFSKLTDLEGNVIFDIRWLDKCYPGAGVEETRPDDSAGSRQAYDLSGKPTTDPAPGTVYIRDGRKEIAR